MRITFQTKTKDVLPLLNEKRLLSILEAVEPVQLDKPLIYMNIGEFIQCMDDNFYIQFLNEEYAWRAFGKIKQWKVEVEKIANLIKSYEVTIDGDDKAAAAGINFPNSKERILLDARDWFGLQCLESDGGRYGATSVPLAEYLIMLKEKSANIKFERNRAKLTEKKWRKNEH